MQVTPRIAPFDEQDILATARLWRESVKHMGLDQPKLTDLAFFEGKLAEVAERCEMSVAWHGSQRAGFMAIAPRTGVLDQIFVHPDAFGVGIGRFLLDHAKARMPRGFTLFTPSANARARRFYEAGGLVVSHEGRHPVWGHPVTHYRWTGLLPSSPS